MNLRTMSGRCTDLSQKLIEYLENKKILILGFGREGRSSYEYIRRFLPEKPLAIADKNPQTLEDSRVCVICGDGYLDCLGDFDIVLKSPGIPFRGVNIPQNTEITCQTDLFLRFCECTTVGITGTKGKTTTAHLVKAVLDANGIKTGIIGTLGAAWGDKTAHTGYTTPESYELQKLLSQMLADGCKCAVMEVSSLGLKAHRTDCISFDTAVFLNISTDHIGGMEHESYEEYYAWKKVLFSHCKRAIGCADDPASVDMLEKAPEKIFFGYAAGSDFRALNVHALNDGECLGVSFDCEYAGKLCKDIAVGLPGDYSVHNALAALAVCASMGISLESQRKALRTARVSGRTEPVEVNDDFAIFIDYAHNGTSLENLLKTMRAYKPKRLICLFGCVGGRAQVRRKEMGTAAGRLSELSIVTSDDPDFENPQAIADEVSRYVALAGGEYITVPDRAEAIEIAVNQLKKGDILMLCGKGHEQYQKINGVKTPFSERECVRKALAGKIKK